MFVYADVYAYVCLYLCSGGGGEIMICGNAVGIDLTVLL